MVVNPAGIFRQTRSRRGIAFAALAPVGVLLAVACGGGISEEDLALAQQTAVDDAVATAIASVPATPTPAPPPTPQPTATPMPTPTPAPVPTPGPDFAEIYRENVFSVFQVDTPGNKGSAWMIDDGVLVTNQHVVGDNDTVLVRQAIDPPFQASVVTVDMERDIALLFFDPAATDAVPLRTGSLTSDDIAEPLIALGYSEGFAKPDGTIGAARVKLGVLSQVIDLGPAGINLTMDAAIDPGESGGPVLNKYGEVVGMNRGFRAATASGEPVFGTSFALHIDDIKLWYQTIKVILSQQDSPATPGPN